MPFDNTNGLDELGADAGPWGAYPTPLALPGIRATPWKIALALVLALVGWAALFACAVGCVWVG